MNVFKHGVVYPFMKIKALCLVISLIFIAVSLVLMFTRGFNFGLDFTGGSLVQVKYEKNAPITQMRKAIASDSRLGRASISKFGTDQEVVIKFGETKVKNLGSEVSSALKGTGNFEIRRVDIIGSKVGKDLRSKGMISLLLAFIGILLYLSFRFEWKFALASIIAIFHDVIITLGFISLFQINVDLDMLAALLTVIGYSLNDTIIVFDRIREEIYKTGTKDFNMVVNISVSKTLSRTFLTSLTTFFVVFSLFVYGSNLLYSFSFTLMIGIIVGTYSSIFIASVMVNVLGFNISKFRESKRERDRKKLEKEKNRAMYQSGRV